MTEIFHPDAECKFAECNSCGWLGLREDLIDDPYKPIDEFCPECGSEDVMWLTREEYAQAGGE